MNWSNHGVWDGIPGRGEETFNSIDCFHTSALGLEGRLYGE